MFTSGLKQELNPLVFTVGITELYSPQIHVP